jgi:hypothetical protein
LRGPKKESDSEYENVHGHEHVVLLQALYPDLEHSPWAFSLASIGRSKPVYQACQAWGSGIALLELRKEASVEEASPKTRIPSSGAKWGRGEVLLWGVGTTTHVKYRGPEVISRILEAKRERGYVVH